MEHRITKQAIGKYYKLNSGGLSRVIEKKNIFYLVLARTFINKSLLCY